MSKKRKHIAVGDWVYRRATYLDKRYPPIIGKVMSRSPGGLHHLKWSINPADKSEEDSYESLSDLVFYCDVNGVMG